MLISQLGPSSRLGYSIISVRWWTLTVLIVATVAVTAPSRSAWADDRDDLELAVSRFKAGKYEEAADHFEALLSRPLDPDAAEDNSRRTTFREARPVFAATLVFIGSAERADQVILDHYLDDPFYELIPGQFHQKVEDRFRAVKAANRSAIVDAGQRLQDRRRQRLAVEQRHTEERELWIELLKEQAAEKSIVRSNSRLVALVPFGAGQFQNDDVGLGVFFAVSQTLAISSAIVSYGVASHFANVDPNQTDPATDQPVSREGLEENFTTARTVNWVSAAPTGALMLAGIIEAQVSFREGDETTEQRDIPPEPELTPTVETTESGGILFGIHGSF